jgi:replication factor A1
VYDFDTIVEEILKSKPELGREALMARVQEKKDTVGSGYLTDQGALFLIAGELGVRLEHVTSSDLRLKDLYVGANDITVVARVLGVYPVTEYDRKDGGKGRYRRLVLFDGESMARLTLWDDKATGVDELKLEAGTPVRIANGYVKQGLDGKPNLNLGWRGSIGVVGDRQVLDKLVELDRVAKKIETLGDEQNVLALDAVVSSEVKSSTFTRSDGSLGSLTQFRVTGPEGKNERRLVVWNPWNLREVKPGDLIRVTNLKIKASSRGEPELHGDAGTAILALKPMSDRKEFRVASVSINSQMVSLLVVDSDKRVLEIELLDEALERGEQLKVGDVIKVAPDEEANGRLRCRKSDSIEVAGATDRRIPQLDSLSVKVDGLSKMDRPVLVEAIALSKGTQQDVHLKDGSVVKKGELVIGDETGEIKLVGWREQGNKVLGVEPGERLRVVGATPQTSKMGVLTLQVSYSTRIEKLRGR